MSKKKKKVEKIFIVPIMERYIEMDVGTHAHFKVFMVRNLPVVVYRSDPFPVDFDSSLLSNYLIGLKSDKLFIEAETPEAAIADIKNYKNYGGDVGAIFLDETKLTWEVVCDRMHKNKRGRLICGPEVGRDGNGEFGGCRLEHYERQPFCPENVP